MAQTLPRNSACNCVHRKTAVFTGPSQRRPSPAAPPKFPASHWHYSMARGRVKLRARPFDDAYASPCSVPQARLAELRLKGTSKSPAKSAHRFPLSSSRCPPPSWTARSGNCFSSTCVTIAAQNLPPRVGAFSNCMRTAFQFARAVQESSG